MGKVKQFIQDVEAILLIMYAKIGMDRPANHDEILSFVVDDVQETADPVNWSDSDVAIAFRRWIESKANDVEEESNDPNNFSDVEIAEFKKNWGQSHSEICANLGYDKDCSEILIDDYFWIEEDQMWYNKSASMYTDREQAIADYLRA